MSDVAGFQNRWNSEQTKRLLVQELERHTLECLCDLLCLVKGCPRTVGKRIRCNH